MHIGWPQAIFLALILFGAGHSAAKFGQQRTGSAAEYDIVDVLISPALVIGLLYWGGFFDAR